MRLKLILVIVGTLTLAQATYPLGSALATSPQEIPTDQHNCTYNGVAKSCVVTLLDDPCVAANHTVLIHWMDGEITSVWFLSNGSTQVEAKVILNHNKRGRITQSVRLEDGRQRLHVKSETGNQLIFILPPTIIRPCPGPDADPLQP